MRRLVQSYFFKRNLLTSSIQSLTESVGFPLQIHKTTTEDGYVLTLHRLSSDSSSSHNSPILLQHGLWSSSDDWIVPGPEKSLGFHLANAGFDVWLGNTRGNYYSRDHITLCSQKNSRDFWDFSWHELGVYDVPAMIDCILKETGRQQLIYLGHSQGTTIFFVMASQKPEYSNKIQSMVAFAPVVYLRHMRNSFLQNLAQYSDPLFKMCNTTGLHRILPQEIVLTTFDSLWSMNPEKAEEMTNVALKQLSYYAADEVKMNIKDIITSRMHTGTPFKLLAHYAQCTQKDKAFRQFDYGPKRNIEIYGQPEAPPYDLASISTPIVAFYSDYDWLTHREDVDTLLSSCENKIKLENVSVPKFKHLDFIWSDLNQFNLFPRLLKYLNI